LQQGPRATSEGWTVLGLLNAAAELFERRGIADTARLDAELLLAETLGCGRIDLYVRFDQPVDDAERARFRELVRRRADRQPVKQILGRCEFLSHAFELTPDVLVPRPATETLVEEALGRLDDAPRLVCDVGTGCGNVAVSVALARPRATVYATDVSEAALAVAGRNAARHEVSDRVVLLAGDLFEPLRDAGPAGQVDVVASNPPYVSEAEFADLMPEVARHEPRTALVSDADGAGHTLRLLAGAPAYLRPGGTLLVETCPRVAGRALEAARATGAYDEIDLRRDLAGMDRVLVARKRG